MNFQPCQCADLSLHAFGFSALLCFLCQISDPSVLYARLAVAMHHIAHLTLHVSNDGRSAEKTHGESYSFWDSKSIQALQSSLTTSTRANTHDEETVCHLQGGVGVEAMSCLYTRVNGGDDGRGKISGASLFLFFDIFLKWRVEFFYSIF